MKKIILQLSIFICIKVSAHKNLPFTITGKIDNIKSGIIYLTIYENNIAKKDSSKIIKGNYNFKGFITKEADAVLDIKDDKPDYLRFYVEGVNMQIAGQGYPLSAWKISHSPLNSDNEAFNNLLKPFTTKYDAFQNLYDSVNKSKNILALDSLDEVDNQLTIEKRTYVKQFVLQHPKSIKSSLAILENYAYYAEATDVESLYNSLDKKVKESASGNDVKKMLDVYKKTAIGQMALDITQKDTLENNISLSSLKGKYILVDFWASWCGPCRRENPNIVNAYNTFKDKGFDIFGVSYDKTKARWTKAIVSDKLVWKQVSDLQGWQNATSNQYYIKAIPANLLLDKQGKIIAKNLFGKKLIAKLSEIMP